MKTIFKIMGVLATLIVFLILIDTVVDLKKRIRLLEVKQDALILQVSGDWEPADLRYKIIKRKSKKEK